MLHLPAEWARPAFLPQARQPATGSSGAGTVAVQGVVEAQQTIPLTVAAHGWVRQIFFVEGEYVRKRQVLLRLYHNDLYSSNFNRQYLLAPQAGFVVRKNVEVGRHVAAGASVAYLQDVAQVKICLLLPPPLAQRLSVCAPVPVSIAELPARSFTGAVESIVAPSASGSRHRVTVLVRNSGSPLIRPRMHATVRLPAQPAPDMARR
ncbi:efflux RND transporter periplasmic adaptor subunit [Microvirga sp. STR05]|uniref:Efflux RND transporter periplasmic adaptor subunit n=1 Tax=Hymenobacter duratus TaxID=2771356 RepID=A0ABR8JKH5_9BACT|nr:efflux RND transporter periplasmic adaptor subunit [Hymenobacter duratus]MBD2716216.1 efflux RND transporter periplasmic adaptor subunit [Hymenobacter duratus]MBR7951130.1 efflux RND transporter periplasmic adaptor subunit [Microvirga sp. STR05]